MKEKQTYFLSIIVLAIAACFSTGYHHFDEHFQILEFAGLKLDMTTANDLPWEFHYQMRSAIQPAMVVILSRGLNAMGIDNPFTTALLLRLLSAGIAFLGIWLIYSAYKKTIVDDKLKKWFLLLSFFTWFMIYNNVRFSSEGWAGSTFLIAFSLLIIRQSPGRLFYLYVGMILGLSFLFRFQAGFLVAGLILWYAFVNKKIGIAVLLSLGVIFLIGLGILIDRWFYGEWTLTSWNYFNQNIVQNKVSDFGITPWWYYFETVFIQAIPPFSLTFILSVGLFFIFKRMDLLTWTIFPFLLIHFIVGHKEIRFLFPIIGFLPIIIIKSIEVIQEKWNAALLNKQFVKIFAGAFWVVNVIFLTAAACMPADNQISLYKTLYSDYKEPVTLYYIEHNPYRRVLDIHFYKRKNLEVVEIGSIRQLDVPTERKKLFVTKEIDALNDVKAKKRLVYSSFPDWIRMFNFNGWLERTNCWYVYELY